MSECSKNNLKTFKISDCKHKQLWLIKNVIITCYKNEFDQIILLILH